MVNIGERLRSERERLGMTQDAFAEAAMAGKRALIRYEKGERSPDAEFLAAIAAVGADVLYIITGTRSQAVPAASLLPEPDRILLDNFHHAPAQVQTGVKTTLGAFAPTSTRPHRGGKKAA